MATVAKLVVQLEAETSALQAGFRNAARYAQDYADLQQRALDNSAIAARAVERLGTLQAAYATASEAVARYAETANGAFRDLETGRFVSSDLVNQLQREAAALEQRVQIQQETVASNTQLAASEREQLAALEQNIAGQTRFNAEQRQLVADLRTQIRTQQDAVTTTTRFGRTLTDADGQLTGLGRRGAQAMFGLGFAVESFANSSEGGFRRGVRAAQSFLLFFGDEGLIAAAAIEVVTVIVDQFRRAEKAVDDATQRMAQSAADALNKADQLQAQAVLREIQFGTPFSVDPKTHDLVANARSQFAQNAFEGSAADLEAHLASVNRQIHDATKAGNVALVGGLTQQANDLEAKLEPIRTRFNTIRNAILNPPDQSRLPAGLPTITITAKGPRGMAADAAHDQAAAIAEIVDRIKLARDGYGDLTAAITAGFAAETRLSDQIAAAHGNIQKTVTLTNQLKSLFDATKFPDVHVPDIKMPEIGVTIDPKQLAANAQQALSSDALLNPLRDAASTYAGLFAQAQLRSEVRVAHGETPLDLDKMFTTYRQNVTQTAGQISDAITHSNLPYGIQVELITEINGLLKQMGIQPKTLTDADQLVSRLQSAASALRGLGDLANALGNSELGNLLNTGANAASNISDALKTHSVGSELGAAASAVALGREIVSALTSNPIQAEHDAVTRGNTEALRELSVKMSGFIPSATNTSVAASDIGAFLQAANAVKRFAANQTHPQHIWEGPAGGGGDLQSQIDAITPFLKGITLDQLASLAKAQNITIYDSHGRLILSALTQLETALQNAATAAFSFTKSFSDQSTLAELRDKLAGKTTAQDDLARNVGLIQQLAPNLIGSTPFDTSTLAGQNAVRASLSELVNNIADGTIASGDFGGFQNLSELTGVIGSVTDSLNSLRTTVDSVTSTMSNVPPGFKIDLARYNATIGLTAPPTVPSITTTAGTTPLSPTTVPTVPVSITHTGDVVVQVPGYDKSPQELAVAIRKEYQAQALSRFGNKARWAETQ